MASRCVAMRCCAMQCRKITIIRNGSGEMNAQSDNIRRVKLGGALDIAGSGALKASLLDILHAATDLTDIILEADAVERADTAGLQLLSAFVQDARAKEIDVIWDRPSEALCCSAKTIGLNNLLGLT